MARNQLVPVVRVSWQSAVTFGKQMLGEASYTYSVNIGCIRSEYEIVPLRFQRFNTISTGIFAC